MGGDIGAESRPTGGSIFWFTVKLPSVEQIAERARPSRSGVEDSIADAGGRAATRRRKPDRRGDSNATPPTRILVGEDHALLPSSTVSASYGRPAGR
jgi:hypothetical protein